VPLQQPHVDDRAGQPLWSAPAIPPARSSLPPSRGRCILPLAVNTAASAPLMTARFGTAAVVWQRILRPLRERCRCTAAMRIRRHCSSGFSLRWPAHGGEGTRSTPAGRQSLMRSISTPETVTPPEGSPAKFGVAVRYVPRQLRAQCPHAVLESMPEALLLRQSDTRQFLEVI
jgi:hypothetical protein